MIRDEVERLPWLEGGMSFLSGLPESARRRRILMPIQAFIDDGKSERKGLFVLAGLYGRAEDWLSFSDDWKAILDAAPRWQRFKWRFAMQRYRRHPGDVQRRMGDFVRAINRYPFTIVSCSLDMRGFKDTIGELAAHTPLKDPYFFPFHSLITQVTEELYLSGHRERCEIFFDEDRIFGPRARAWYPVSQQLMRPELEAIAPVDPLFRTDDEFMPLQAADLIVGFLRSEIENANHPFSWIRGEIDKDKWSPNSRELSREHWEAVCRESLANAARIAVKRLLAQGPPE